MNQIINNEDFRIPSGVRNVLHVLDGAGYEAWLVGGCVRDHMMGLPPKDFDVATSATADRVIAAFAGFRVIGTGLKHGTVTVLSEGVPVEVTTYRVDGRRRDISTASGAGTTSPAKLSAASATRTGGSARTRCAFSAPCGSRRGLALPSSRPPRRRFTGSGSCSGKSPSNVSRRSFSDCSAATARAV